MLIKKVLMIMKKFV